MQQAESDFVNDMKSFVVQGFDPSATDWRPLQHDAGLKRAVLEHLNSEDALRELAQIFVLKAMLQAHGTVQSDPDFDRKVHLVVEKFSSPLRLYREIAKRIVMSGCDLTKRIALIGYGIFRLRLLRVQRVIQWVGRLFSSLQTTRIL
jgi:hypothetical protein